MLDIFLDIVKTVALIILLFLVIIIGSKYKDPSKPNTSVHPSEQQIVDKVSEGLTKKSSPKK